MGPPLPEEDRDPARHHHRTPSPRRRWSRDHGLNWDNIRNERPPSATKTDPKPTPVEDSLLASILNPSDTTETLHLIEKELADMLGLVRILHFPSTMAQKDDENERTLEECVFDICPVWHAYQRLLAAGHCSSHISILLQDPLRPNIAIATKIEDRIFNSLTTHSELVHEELLAGVEFESSENMMALERVIEEVFQLFQFSENYVPSRIEERIEQVRVLLSLALISFAGSHVSAFDDVIFSSTIEVFPLSNGFGLRRHNLACLSKFIGGKAWIFGNEEKPETEGKGKGKATKEWNAERSSSVENEFLVSINVNEFATLWGPVWAAPADLQGKEIQTLYTERGFIIPCLASNQSAASAHNEMETCCHWYEAQPVHYEKGVTFRFSDENDIPSTETIEFAMNITLSSDSQLLLGMPSNLRVNENCASEMDQIQRSPSTNLQFPGVYPAHHVPDATTATISAGKFITVGLSRASKPVPASTLKSRLVFAASTFLPEQNPTERHKQVLNAILDQYVGLNISACTRNAIRIKLREVIDLSEFKPIVAQSGSKVIDTQSVALGQVGTSGRRPTKSIASNFKRHDRPIKDWVNGILNLQCTGVDEAGNFQAYWPFSKTPQTLCTPHETWKENHRWVHLIRDTHLTATFAVVSNDCIESGSDMPSQHRMRCKNPGHNRLPLSVRGEESNRSILGTKIHVKFDSGPESQTKPIRGKVLRKGDQIELPQAGSLTIEYIDFDKHHVAKFQSLTRAMPNKIFAPIQGLKVYKGQELMNEEVANKEDIISAFVL